jgi:hypothetical protein
MIVGCTNEYQYMRENMASDQPIMCVLCLDMDDQDAMLHIHVEHARINQRPEYYICRLCAYAIAEFLRESGELSFIDEEDR